MAGHWLHRYWRMLAWDFADFRIFVPVLGCVLVLQGAGFAYGIGLLFGRVPEEAAIYVCTGAPVLNLITAGLIFEPQAVAEQRIRGSYEFLQALPVPRSAAALAWYTVSLLTALPAVVLTLLAAIARYHLSLAVTPMIVPAVLLTCLTGVLMGLAVAHGVTAPAVANLISMTLIFVMFGFSPIVFPASQLPGWLAAREPVAPVRLDGGHRAIRAGPRLHGRVAARLRRGGRVGGGIGDRRGVGAGKAAVGVQTAGMGIRRGPVHWASSYAAMLRFDLAAQRNFLPTFLIMQILFGAGMAIIYGFYIGHLSPAAALYIVSGAPALAMLTAGLMGVEMMVTERQQAGTWDFIWSMPAPRSAAVASIFTVFTLLAIPGIVVTLALADLRYGIALSVSPMAVPAVLLSSLMATSLGFCMAVLIGKPMVTNAILNALIFVVLMFSPVQFPISRLPLWLADAHRVLPIYYLAEVLRASVTRGLVHDTGLSYAVLGAWTLASWAATAWVVGRRR